MHPDPHCTDFNQQLTAHRNLFPCLLTGRFQLLTEETPEHAVRYHLCSAAGLPGQGGNEEMSSDARRSTA